MGRRRRLSSGFGFGEPDASGDAVSALDQSLALGVNDDEAEKQVARSNRRKSFLGTPNRRRSGAARKSMSIIRSSEDTDAELNRCIELSNANKITQKNSWDLNLIDCLPSVVSEGSETNFTKASCTIDASVQIYSHRVDSVHIQMFKVLGGLHRSEDNDDGGGEPGENEERKKRKASSRAVGSTIEKNVDALNVKKGDIVVEVDAMFQKTSAAFDEGGAAGLLLNQLGVGKGCQIVFDSSTTLKNDEDDDKCDESKQVDMSMFSKTWAAISSGISLEIPALVELRGACETLDLPKTQSRNVSFHDPDTGWVPDDDDDGDEDMFQGDICDADAFFGVEDNEDLDRIRQREEEIQNMDMGDIESLADIDSNDFAASGSSVPSNRRTSFKIHMSLAAADDDYAYLDADIVRNWNGPGASKHWKFRAPVENIGDASKNDGPKKKKKKQKGTPIDFAADPVDREVAFARPPRTDNTLSKKKQIDHLDPPNFHITVSSFRRLFLRPRVLLRLNKEGSGQRSTNHNDGACFDYENPNDVSNFLVDFDGGIDEGDDDDAMMFGDVPGDFGEVGESGIGLSDFSLIEQPERAARIDINFAKTAKKVDVKALKRNIWAKLSCDTRAAPCLDPDEVGECASSCKDDIIVSGDQPSSADDLQEEIPNTQTEDSWPTFQKTMETIHEQMPESTRQNTSVPFFFVCLLHLANENSLLLKPGDALGDFAIARSNADEEMNGPGL